MWSIFKSPKTPRSAKSGNAEYRLGRRFDPGAEAEVFEQTHEYPVIFFRGNARVAGQFGIFQPPQVTVPGVIGINGLGGVQAGQYVGQPLIDPSQLNSEGGE
jgi:hypothetical protein